MYRYKLVRDSGLIGRWEKASAADPSLSYTDDAFVEPMRCADAFAFALLW
jgi:hypothetical protein